MTLLIHNSVISWDPPTLYAFVTESEGDSTAKTVWSRGRLDWVSVVLVYVPGVPSSVLLGGRERWRSTEPGDRKENRTEVTNDTRVSGPRSDGSDPTPDIGV